MKKTITIMACLISLSALAQQRDTITSKAFIGVADTTHFQEEKWQRIPCPKDSVINNHGADSCMEKVKVDRPIHQGEVLWIYGFIQQIRANKKVIKVSYYFSDGKPLKPDLKILFVLP